MVTVVNAEIVILTLVSYTPLQDGVVATDLKAIEISVEGVIAIVDGCGQLHD